MPPQLSHEAAYEEACRKGEIPGAVLIAADATGKFRYGKAFGKTARGEKLALDSVMWIASCTKLMTAVAALQQVERGKIGLDDDVATLLPELAALEVIDSFDADGKPVLVKRTEKITLRILLSHTSGHGYEILDPKLLRLMESNPPRPTTTPRTIPEDFWHPLAFQPGHGWSYGPSLDWAGKLVERLSGLKLEAYMRANIWEPLGMQNLAFDLRTRPDLEKRKVSLSARGEDGRLTYTDQGYSFPYWERDDHYGGSSVWASAESFLPLLQTLCANDGRVLAPRLADELFRPQLGAEAKAALNHTVKAIDLTRRVYGNAFNVQGQEFDQGLGGVVGLRDDVDSRRAAGTLSWGGAPNLIWWIDRRSGLCGACFTQLVPVGDVKVNEMMKLFEKAVYENYQTAKAKL